MPAKRSATPPDVPRATGIEVYRAKRDFSRTGEPAPSATPASSAAAVFVVQKHDATRLHYDFRLEHGGVLWSWAVPRGPSMDPGDKRLAVHVEDHPLDYAGFEGTIPAGQYGAGTVEIWDRGTWSGLGQDPAADLSRGEMKFALAGSRLQGRFVLIRLKKREREAAENWLLIKEHDEHERAGMTVAELEQVALAPLPAPAARRLSPAPAARRKPMEAGAPAPGAVRGALPEQQAPQLATAAAEPASDGAWLSEIKLDGYRLLAFKDGDSVRLVTRNGLDWTHRMAAVARVVGETTPRALLLDGELVALRPDGRSSFPDLQAALSDGRTDGLFFYAFDLLHLDGWDLRPCRLDARKAALAGLSIWNDLLRYSDHVAGDAAPVRREACAMGLEGVIAKRADAPYRAGRGADWLKLKCQNREEFVVVGWTPPSGSRSGIGALHLGFHDAAGALHYVGAVGTGFDDKTLAALRKRLDPMKAPSPDAMLLTAERPDSKITWVRPELVAEVSFTGWSGAGRVRHAVFLGLREDKAGGEVVREVPDPEQPRAPLRSARAAVVTAKPPGKAPLPVRKPVATPSAASAGAVKLTHPRPRALAGHHQADIGGLLGRRGGSGAAGDRRSAARPGALPGRRGRPAFLPEARHEGDAAPVPRGRAGRRPLSRLRRRGRPAGRGADGRGRAAQLGQRPAGCRPGGPAGVRPGPRPRRGVGHHGAHRR